MTIPFFSVVSVSSVPKEPCQTPKLVSTGENRGRGRTRGEHRGSRTRGQRTRENKGVGEQGRTRGSDAKITIRL